MFQIIYKQINIQEPSCVDRKSQRHSTAVTCTSVYFEKNVISIKKKQNYAYNIGNNVANIATSEVWAWRNLSRPFLLKTVTSVC